MKLPSGHCCSSCALDYHYTCEWDACVHIGEKEDEWGTAWQQATQNCPALNHNLVSVCSVPLFHQLLCCTGPRPSQRPDGCAGPGRRISQALVSCTFLCLRSARPAVSLWRVGFKTLPCCFGNRLCRATLMQMCVSSTAADRVGKSSSGCVSLSIHSEDSGNRQQHQEAEGGDNKGLLPWLCGQVSPILMLPVRGGFSQQKMSLFFVSRVLVIWPVLVLDLFLQILSDTRELQKEINSLTGKLDRTFAVTDELVFKVGLHLET